MVPLPPPAWDGNEGEAFAFVPSHMLRVKFDDGENQLRARECARVTMVLRSGGGGALRVRKAVYTHKKCNVLGNRATCKKPTRFFEYLSLSFLGGMDIYGIYAIAHCLIRKRKMLLYKKKSLRSKSTTNAAR